jgi:hypothetical protein
MLGATLHEALLQGHSARGERTKHTVRVKFAYVKFIMATIFFTTIGRITFVVITIALFCLSNCNTFHLFAAKMVHEWRTAYCDKQVCSQHKGKYFGNEFHRL